MDLRIWWSAASLARILSMAAIVFAAQARVGLVRASGGVEGWGREGAHGLNSIGATPACTASLATLCG
jgi:hypothetical protein